MKKNYNLSCGEDFLSIFFPVAHTYNIAVIVLVRARLSHDVISLVLLYN